MLTEQNITPRQAKILELKNQGHTREDMLKTQASLGFADNSVNAGIVNDIELVYATPNEDKPTSESNVVLPNQDVPDIFPNHPHGQKAQTKQAQVEVATARKQADFGQYSTLAQFDAHNPNASYGERSLAHANIMQSHVDTSTTLGQDLNDTAVSTAATAIKIPLDKAAGAIDFVRDPVGSLVTGGKYLATGAAELVGKREEFDETTSDFFNDLEYFIDQANKVTVNSNPGFKMLHDAMGTIAETISGFSGDVGEAKEELLSDGFKNRRAERKEITEKENAAIDAALPEDASIGQHAYAGVKKLLNTLDNMSAEEILVEAGASSPYSIKVGKAYKKGSEGASKDVTSDEVIKAGSVDKAISKKQSKAGARAATAEVAILEGTANATEVRNEILELPFSELSNSYDMYNTLIAEGKTQEEARSEVASKAARGTLISSGVLAAGANVATGGVLEKVLGKGKSQTKTDAVKDVGKAAITEVPEEAIAGGGGQLLSNVAKQDTVNPEQDVFEGVESAALEGAVLGGTSAGVTAGGTKVIGATGRGLKKIAEIPAGIKAKREARKLAAEIEASLRASPTQSVVEEAETVLAPVAEMEETSEEVTAMKASAQQVRDHAKNINEAVSHLDPDENNLGSLLTMAAEAQVATSNLYEEAVKAVNNPDTTPEMKAALENVITHLENPSSDSIVSALGQEIQKNPPLASAIDTAFKAATTGDTEALVSVLSAIDSVGKTDEISEGLTNALMETALYSMDLIGDSSISSDQLLNAADQTTGEVSQRYKDLAVVKDLDIVANEVTDGKKEFKGVNTHLTNLKQAVANNKPARVRKILKQLGNFSSQRTEKAEALEAAIEEFDGTKPITANWGNKGKWTISPEAVLEEGEELAEDYVPSIDRTIALAKQVRKEEIIVNNAVTAANNIVEGTNNEVTPETAEAKEAVETETPTTADTQPTETSATEELTPYEELLSPEDLKLSRKIPVGTKRDRFVRTLISNSDNDTIKGKANRLDERVAAEAALANPDSTEAELVAAHLNITKNQPYNAAEVSDQNKNLTELAEREKLGLGVTGDSLVHLRETREALDAIKIDSESTKEEGVTETPTTADTQSTETSSTGEVEKTDTEFYTDLRSNINSVGNLLSEGGAKDLLTDMYQNIQLILKAIRTEEDVFTKDSPSVLDEISDIRELPIDEIIQEFVEESSKEYSQEDIAIAVKAALSASSTQLELTESVAVTTEDVTTPISITKAKDTLGTVIDSGVFKGKVRGVIAKVVLKNLPESVVIETVNPNHPVLQNVITGKAGYGSYLNGVIYIAENTPEALKAELVLHEAIHAILVPAAKVTSNKTDKEKQFINDINKLLRLMRKTAKRDKVDKVPEIEYALQNVDEFLAMGMSNPLVMDWLSKAKVQKKTLLSRFAEMIGKFLDIPPNHYSALEEMLNISSLVLDTGIVVVPEVFEGIQVPSLATPIQIESYVEEVTQNPELKDRQTEDEFATAQDKAIADATEAIDLNIEELEQYRILRRQRLRTVTERAKTNDAFIPEITKAEEDIAAIETEINLAKARREEIATRAAKQHQLDWDLGVDQAEADTKSKQLTTLVKDILGSIIGKRATKAIEKTYDGIKLSNPESITSFVRDLTVAATEEILNYVNNLKLTIADRASFNRLLGASKSIQSAPNALLGTLASLKDEYTGQHDLGLDNKNRYKEGVISYRASKLWEDTDYLTELSSVETIEDLEELGFDVSRINSEQAFKQELATIKGILTKRAWFFDKMNKYNDALQENLKTDRENYFSQSKLRFLLDEQGRFPTKVVDAAFMAYLNATNPVGESIYNDDRALQSLLGLTDKSLLGEIDSVGELRVMGTPVTTKTMGNEFKQAMAIQHTASIPQSVTDSLNSAMGGLLVNMLKSDTDFLNNTVTVETGTGTFSYVGFTLNTPEANKIFHSVNSPKTKVAPKATDGNFSWNKNQSNQILRQISEPIDNAPSNWVGERPPKVTTSDNHIRSNDKLTDDQVKAENISRSVEHEVDPTVASFHKAIGLKGFKAIKGYVEDTSNLNVEHKLAVDGKNQEINDSYSKADKLLNKLETVKNKVIYFEGMFSSVRRQQRKGEVNDQGDKYHRILIGLKNNATIPTFDLNNLTGLEKGTAAYNFVLALAQAYGFDVDKQANSISVNEMLNKLGEVTSGDSLESDLASRMVNGQLTEDSMTADIINALTGKSDHEIQGILTVARLMSSAKGGVVTNFKHYMKAEVDGLTNGPAHSTIMNGLAGLDPNDIEDTLARGGYLVGDGTDNNTHVQIGQGRIVDFYKTVAAKANDALSVFYESQLTDEGGKAQGNIAAYDFLATRGVAIAGEFDSNGKVVGIKLTRNGTKNPVTVTVYGGGARGIHAKMASELRDLFAQELSALLAKDKLSRKELDETLSGWSYVFYGNASQLPLIKATRNGAKVRQAIQEFSFDTAFKEQSLARTRDLYGKYATDAIDSIFNSNKRSATLMNASLNFVTTQINDTFSKAYEALHTKRVEEGAITEYDTLSTADVGLIQRKLEAMYPQVRTAIGDTTNVAKKGQDRASSVGVGEVRYPSLTAKTPSRVQVEHSTKNMALPGVRAIPVLTISIDGAVQINNHLLQGHQGNFLNVLDAIDRIADENLRASNELFNVAEFMGLMNHDTLASVENAVNTALQAQTQPIEIEGIEILPTLATVDIQDGDARLELSQEVLRQSVKDITNPIANELGLTPIEIGNTKEFLQYLLKQLSVERQNNKLARENFIFGNPEIAIDQMAGIDDGHAKVVKGQVVLSSEADALLSEDGRELLRKFNARMADRYAVYTHREETDKLTEATNTELEQLRQRIADDAEDTAAQAQVANILSPLKGIWQDLRGTFDLDTGSFTFKLTGTNKAKFKKVLNPEFNPYDISDTATGVTAPIPTVGKVLNDLLGVTTFKGKGKRRKATTRDYLDNLLDSIEVQVVPNLPTLGSYEAERRGNKVIRVIKVREGLTTEIANIVLAHELIHAATQNGIHIGLTDKNSIEREFVEDLWKQLTRMLKVMGKQKDIPESAKYLRDLYEQSKTKPELVEKTLNEFIAYVGSERDAYAPFLEGTVSKDILSKRLQKVMHDAWNALTKYLTTKLFGARLVEAQSYIKHREELDDTQVYEEDILAQLFAGLGQNGLAKIDTKLDSIDHSRESLNPAQEVIKAAEGQSDAILYKGANLAIEASLRTLGNLGIGITAEGAEDYINMTPAQKEEHNKRYIDRVLTGQDEGERTGFIRSTFGEFFARSSNRSQTLDEHNDKAKHESDAEREYSKEVVAEAIIEHTGELTDEENQAVLNSVIRGELFSYSDDPTLLRSMLDSDVTLENEITNLTNQIHQLPNVNQRKKNLMINEATSLGARSITGGAYRGLNLPNAKAIVQLVGSGMEAVNDSDGSIEKLVDNLATLTGIQTLSAKDRIVTSNLLRRKPDALKYVSDTHKNVVNKISTQYGEGKLLSLPKGFIPDQVNPNRAIKVVPWADRSKYKGYHFKREFSLETADPTKNKRMALLVSSEGGNPPYVQGAMSTIESAIGGFTTQYGSATDKALPAITSIGGVVATNKQKRKIADRLSQKVRKPKLMQEGMLPNINGMGKVVGYRYAISHSEREDTLEASHEVADVLSAYDARLGEQQIAEKFNKELVDKLYDAYNAEELTLQDQQRQFVKVYADADDSRISEAWRVIPQHTKAAIKEKFGGNFVYVHKRDFDNALGYREWSISKLWSDNLEDGSKRQMFVDIADTILGDDAVNKLRYAERILQEGVVAAKDIIVVKSIVVPVANAFSNAYHLLVLGVSPQDILRGYRESGKGLQEFKRDIRALKHAEQARDVTGVDNSAEIAAIEKRLNDNPIKFMVDAGLLSTVIEDTTKVSHRGTAKEALLDKYIPDVLKQQDNVVLDIGKNLILTQDSWTYNKLSNGLELGDFGAKYIQYKHLRSEGESHQDALDRVRVEFVNYNTLSNKQLDYANKVGGVFFFKYFARIQSIIARTIKENPTRALTAWSGIDTVELPSVFEAIILDKDITNTTGAYDLLNMAGGAHPLTKL